jgi:16S rRNA (cytidine1402-2'-O)-methyltransferase
MAGVLYLVSTPIGNLEDLTARAASVLGEVAACYAEDTRRTGRLLAHLGHDVSLRSLHAHNEAERVEEILRRLESGEDCAIATDAGTPTVSDPGRRVVEAAHRDGYRVVPIPGPSAVTTALAVSGLPADRFAFLGFAPRRGRARDEWRRQLIHSPVTVVVFESPRRLERLLVYLNGAGLSDRECVLCRELTKLHEEVDRGTIGQLLERWAGETVRGEVTLVIAGATSESRERDEDAIERVVHEMNLSGASTRDIADRLFEEFGIPRNEAYQIGLAVEPGEDA